MTGNVCGFEWFDIKEHDNALKTSCSNEFDTFQLPMGGVALLMLLMS